MVIKIGIVTALAWEAECLAHIQQPSLLTELTGVGHQAAREGALKLIKQGANVLISFGCATALAPKLIAGTVLLPRHVITRNNTQLNCDNMWQQQLSQHLTHSCDAPLMDTITVLSSASEKAALASNSQAVAADMESAAILKVAEEHTIPAVVARVVLDSAEQSLPIGLMDCCDNYARPQPLRLAAWLMRSPSHIPTLFGLAKAQHKARKSLINLANAIVKE